MLAGVVISIQLPAQKFHITGLPEITIIGGDIFGVISDNFRKLSEFHDFSEVGNFMNLGKRKVIFFWNVVSLSRVASLSLSPPSKNHALKI